MFQISPDGWCSRLPLAGPPSKTFVFSSATPSPSVSR
jgi:hypothetical protein